jgi:hypothetical protein
MHFEILVEDQSGKKMLEILMPKIVSATHTFNIHAYKGIGRIPKNLRDSDDPSKRILLDNLPRLLRGYGVTFANYPPDYLAAVILVCDLDQKCLKEFREELFGILENINPRPETRFCIAIEEGESWFLGDLPAIKSAYPKAKDAILNHYVSDSICGTWETLADAVCIGGAQELACLGFPAIGKEKGLWAEMITPNMDVENNRSPSFCYFRRKIRELVGMG